MSTPYRIPKPLSLTDRLLIEVVTTRYEGISEGWIAFDYEHYVELRVPERIRLDVTQMKERRLAATHSVGND